jgi:hypothetical protein
MKSGVCFRLAKVTFVKSLTLRQLAPRQEYPVSLEVKPRGHDTTL